MFGRNLGDIYGPIEDQVEQKRKEGWRIARFKNIPLIVAYQDWKVSEKQTKYLLKGWYGKARVPHKSLSGYYYRTAEERANKVETVVSNLARHEARKIENRKKKSGVKASDFWAVGDVVEYSWGYDQTNVDFFQVVRVLKKSVEIAEIGQKCDDHGGPSGGHCAPVRYKNLGKPFKKMVTASGYLSFDHGIGTKWDGKQVWTSSYH